MVPSSIILALLSLAPFSALSNPLVPMYFGNATAHTEADKQLLPDGGASGHCVLTNPAGPDDYINQADMKACLTDLGNQGWSGLDCASYGWYKGHMLTYNSVSDCDNYCHKCIETAIELNATNVDCRHYPGITACWTGYHVEELATSGST